jgi:hypothetical protein
MAEDTRNPVAAKSGSLVSNRMSVAIKSVGITLVMKARIT